MFSENYSNDGSPSFTQKERFEEFNREINAKISNALYNKQQCKISYNELFNILATIKSNISTDSYEVNFTEFANRSDEKYQDIIKKNARSARQLRLVNDTEKFVIDGLIHQLFYEDLRNYYVNVGKDNDILDLESNAKDNFENVKGLLLSKSIPITPAILYYETIQRNISSPLFKTNSAQYPHYNKGCYIHLTDDNEDETNQITWGTENEK